MKNILKILSFVLALCCILPLAAAAYPLYAVDNPTVGIPLSTPVNDGETVLLDPLITIDNFDIHIINVDGLCCVRYAPGEYTSRSELKKAEGLIQRGAAYIAEHTDNGVFSTVFNETGLHTFWLRFDDGREYIMYAATDTVAPSITIDGLRLTLSNIDNIYDLFIAHGTCDVYREVSNNRVLRIPAERVGAAHSYSCDLPNPGEYTVLIRYDGGRQTFLYATASVTVPEVITSGLCATVSNLDGAKLIRTAPGIWKTAGEVKRATGCRNFTQRSHILGRDSYTFRYAEPGVYTIVVQYDNGYIDVSTVEVLNPEPSVVTTSSGIIFGDLDGIAVIRYAQGEYATIKDVKAAPGAKYSKPANAVDGKITIDGLDGRYTFAVQYEDASTTIYTFDFTYETIDTDAVDVASSRQLFIDDLIVDTTQTTATRTLHSPQKQERVFNFSAGWEAGDTVYHNIVELPDGGYRMYYKATADTRHICYIESADGLSWSRPKLTVWSFNSTRTNSVTDNTVNPDNLFVFYDTNPACPESERWKGIYGQWGDGLFLEYSSDGRYFRFYPDEAKMMGTPDETAGCYFDTLNTVYWDAERGKYVAFVRGFHEGDNYLLDREYVYYNPTRITRDIRYSESDDCINWSTPVPLYYSDGADCHMYASAAMPYTRADGVYIAIPTRYNVTAVSDGVVTGAYTDNLFMASRDLVNWTRFDTQYMLPRTNGTLIYGDCYPCVGMIETRKGELSLYMKEKASGTNTYGKTVLYRYSLRTDGFVSMDDGTLTTLPITFEGSSMLINCKANAGGYVRITLTAPDGTSVTSDPITGDNIDVDAGFSAADLASLSSGTCRITFEIVNAELYSFKFE